ncbi:MAG: DUF3368 domain-containing protein, partial [Waterburya sp.]
MLEVIVDTSPIQYLYQTNLLNLLPTLYGQITIPQAVLHELAQGKTQGIDLPDPVLLSWISICPVKESELIPPLTNLGLGEREVLTLAVNRSEPLTILDDALARNDARQLGILFTGTLGVLLKAKQAGYIQAIAPILAQLDMLR